MFAFLSHPIGQLVLLRILFGNGGGFAPGAPSTPIPSTPFPVAKPPSLPPWPTGWCPDLPPPAEVVNRGWDLLPTLWAKGEGTRTVEMVGGRYITFVATTVDGQKAIAAYRSTNCEAVPFEAPTPLATTNVSPQAAPPVDTKLLDEAVVMNEALKVRGYKKSDMRIYSDFQTAAGIKADGYPGAVTMLKLQTVLQNAGYGMAPVRVYPWKATGAYDGINAPTVAEWEGTATPKTSPVAQAARPPTPARPAPGAAPAVAVPPAVIPAAYTSSAPANPAPPSPSYSPGGMTNVQVQHNLNLLGYKGADGLPLKEDGILGPNSKFAVSSFQRGHPPLAVDSIAGPQTKSALAAAVALQQAFPSAPSAAPAATVVPTQVVSSNQDVQSALNTLGYRGSNGAPLTVDGKIGPQSIYAIKAFQKEHPPLAVDGIAGPKTKSALSTALASRAA